ncbi:MAG: hypothetical protein WC716_05455 [Chitinophagaceae bacterium]|jgi:cell division protein FtsZ
MPIDTTDIENVPAYLRKDKNLEQGANSEDKFHSGYIIGVNNNGDEINQAAINTINTFDGKKPD